MRILLFFYIVITIITITSLLNSCCGVGSYDGRFANYCLDKNGNFVIRPKVRFSE